MNTNSTSIGGRRRGSRRRARSAAVLACGAALAGTGSLLAGASAASADTTCSTSIFNQTIAGNLLVPSGAFCGLHNVTVKGRVTVAPGGELSAPDSGDVLGGLTARNAGNVFLDAVTVRGATLVTGGDPDGTIENSFLGTVIIQNIPARAGSFFEVSNNQVHGALVLRSSAAAKSLARNTVSGPILVTRNTGDTDVSNNTSFGPLLCSGNVPAPTGGGNAASHLSGQCSILG